MQFHGDASGIIKFKLIL